MALLDSPLPTEIDAGCAVVSRYRLLGCLVDNQLSFLAQLKEVAARGRSQFEQIFHAAESGGFSVPVLAKHIDLRVVPGILFLAPLLLLAP
eukprot:353362-Karenia_brevis.AAC.1